MRSFLTRDALILEKAHPVNPIPSTGRLFSVAGLLRLTRWPEHVVFTIPATLLGVDLAAAGEGVPALSGRVLAVLAANLLAVTFAFMLNDIEDARDDARDPIRAARNAVTSGQISARDGAVAAVVVALAALALYAAVGSVALGVGALTLALGALYSWRGVRLKALPGVDVLSHLLMLSVLLCLAGYVAHGTDPARASAALVGVGLISAYGQLYNQLRDYDQDSAAGLRNTAHVLGPRRTRIALGLCLGGAAFSLGVSIAGGAWPLWLAIIPLAGLPLLWRRRASTDMRGTAAIDASGGLQLGAMLVANAVVLAWWLALLAR